MTQSEVAPHRRRDGLASAWFHYVSTHEWAATLMGRLWNTDTEMLWADIERLTFLPEGAAVIDVPCGGGSAFRGIPFDRGIRYCAVDVAASQLDRAKAEAVELGHPEIEFTRADVTVLPYRDGTFDACVSYGGLHCFPDPRRGLREIARVLRPGAELRGSTVVTGDMPSRLLVALCQRADTMGPAVGDVGRLRADLTAAGYVGIDIRTSGLLAYFSARTPG